MQKVSLSPSQQAQERHEVNLKQGKNMAGQLPPMQTFAEVISSMLTSSGNINMAAAPFPPTLFNPASSEWLVWGPSKSGICYK